MAYTVTNWAVDNDDFPAKYLKGIEQTLNVNKTLTYSNNINILSLHLTRHLHCTCHPVT